VGFRFLAELLYGLERLNVAAPPRPVSTTFGAVGDVMAQQRVINRNYVCRFCGRMCRAPADYVPGGPPAPECCGHPMRSLSYEQTVAATQLSEAQRTAWLAAGGEVAERGGKRRWKAIW
jgi:hypothetical protein